MKKTKLSLSIPYKQRLENIEIVFDALANQTMDPNEFEVIVGAMEYCNKYLNLCKKYLNRLNIISVLSGAEFSIPRARNLAMRQASGHVVVQMDADTLLPATALQNLYDRHFAFGQNICVVGQVVGYGNNNDGSVENVEVQSYEKYQEALLDLESTKGNPRDQRFQAEHVLPWAFGWTGLIALPLSLVHKHELYFDEDFHGWGTDDLEWSYRICQTGTPIVLCEDVYAVHLPHVRDAVANEKTGRENYRRFLTKWPRPDVELACAFGDVDANAHFLKYMDEQRRLTSGKYSLGSVRGNVDGKDTLIVGVAINEKNQLIDSNIINLFNNSSSVEVLPLIGMALPYQDKTIQECRVLSSVSHLPSLYLDAIKTETERISKKVVYA